MVDTKIPEVPSEHPLQSPEWAEFRRAWGNEVIKTQYGYLTTHRIPFTSHKVGVFEKGTLPTQEILTDLIKVAKENNLLFVKLEPNVAMKIYPPSHPEFSSGSKDMEILKHLPAGKAGVQNDKSKIINLLRNYSCVPGKTLFTPTTFWIDLTKSEEELLASFDAKTRYNIRLAQRKGVKVVEDNSDVAFESYLKLMRETVERQGFYAHSEKYHRLMWQYLYHTPTTEHRTPIAHLLTAKYNDEIITAWVVFAYNNFLYYPYGASSEKYKNVMANNLMMWETIRFGKKLGLSTFDLWGREPGKGFTKFKEGYNPSVVEFLGTWDLVINKPLYQIYRFAETIRWLVLRGRTKLGLIKPKF